MDAGMFDQQIYYSEDLDLWLRLLHQGARIGYIRQPLVKRRTHKLSLTTHVERLIRSQRGIGLKLLETLPDLTLSEKALLQHNVARCEARLLAISGIRQLVNRRYQEALQALTGADLILRDWKLLGARIGLRMAPRIARFICIFYLARAHAYLLPASLEKVEALAGMENPDRARMNDPLSTSPDRG
jgi:hypothetical protein